MKIWIVSRKDYVGYDEWDAFVCFAESQEQALSMHPYHELTSKNLSGWTTPKNLSVEYLGSTDRLMENPHVILASFNAG